MGKPVVLYVLCIQSKQHLMCVFVSFMNRQKEKETTVDRLTDEMDVLKEKLKIKQEQIDNLWK